MTTTHTPGPWTLSDEDSPLLFDANGAYIAQVFSRTDADTGILRDHYASDARLIAAAPDLLRALQALSDSIRGREGRGLIELNEALTATDAAIARATGGAA